MTVSYRPVLIEDVLQLSKLHHQSLQDGLLYNLGEKYINIFYNTGIKSSNCFGFLAIKEQEVIGAAIATKNIDVLKKRLLLNFSFLLGLAKVIFKLKKLYPSGTVDIPIKQEFILFFVKPEHRNLYVALNLMKLIDQKYAELGVPKYSLEVKEDNKTANLLYQRFGFSLTHAVGEGNNKRLFYQKIPHDINNRSGD